MIKTDMFKPDDIHNDRFIIIKKVGDGGQANTYLAFDTSQMKNIVLKVAQIKPINKQKIISQFKLIKAFDHPNIIKAYQSYDKQINKILYLFIILEYAQGGELKGFLGKLNDEEIQNIYHQIKSVIQYIHTRGVIHRDLTLSNILLDKMKNVKIIDFGIATQFTQQKSLIETPQLQGTRLYKPRQLIQDLIVTKQNDLWQFGITLIQLVTGKEITQITNNKVPCFIENFPEQVFIKYKIKNKFRSMISPLLRKQYKERKFCEDIILTEIPETMSKIQIGNNKKGIKIKSRQPIQLTQSSMHESILKLTKITDIQLNMSIKQQHMQHLIQLNCSDSLLNDECGKTIKLLNKLQKLDMSGNQLTDKFTQNIEPILYRLITLKLAFTSIRDDSIQLITKKSLIMQQLDISYTFISSTGIMMLAKLTKLTSLAIWSGLNYYPHRYQDIIINMRNNKQMYNDNKITINQQTIKQFCNLNLREICLNASGRDINELIFRISKQSICVQLRGKMSSKAVEYICGMEKLQIVYLQGVEAIQINGFISKELISCELVGCKIEKYGLIKSLSKCNKMRNLNLDHNNIGKQGAIEIAKNMNFLISLNLNHNNIENQGAINIAKNMKNLSSLHLWWNNIDNNTKQIIEKMLINTSIWI